MSSSPLVLITGGNGFVGYAVLAGTLKAGVRAALSKKKKPLQSLSNKRLCLLLLDARMRVIFMMLRTILLMYR